jgi:hypothetical protein
MAGGSFQGMVDSLFGGSQKPPANIFKKTRAARQLDYAASPNSTIACSCPNPAGCGRFIRTESVPCGKNGQRFSRSRFKLSFAAGFNYFFNK